LIAGRPLEFDTRTQEGAALAAELMPIFHFRMDDVAWD
jgi:hypothetical protein